LTDKTYPDQENERTFAKEAINAKEGHSPVVDAELNPPRDGRLKAGRVAKAVRQLKFALSDRQLLAQHAEDPYVLYGGAKGGGKSWWLCIWMFSQALKYKGNKLFFCRRRSVDFTNTTLETWKKAIPNELFRVNEQKKKIFIDVTKSVIDYGGLDDPLLIQSLNSAEYGAIGVDQAEEIDKDSFAMLRGTLRHKLPGGSEPSYLVRLTANPAQCWLKDDFLLNPKPGFKFIPALPTDNPYLPSGYVDNLAEAFAHRPALLQAYLHGSWDDLSGHDIVIQQSWVEQAVNKQPYDAVLKRIIVNDPARFGDDENVIYVMEQTPNCAYIKEQIFLENKSTMDTAGRLAILKNKYNATLIAVDEIGIGAGIVDALNELGEETLALNSSSKPTRETKEKKYFNLRTQMWMEAAEKFSAGEVSIPNDHLLKGQLASPKFKFTTNGKVQVESKDDIKKRLHRSPDRADAFVMGLYALEQSPRLDASEYYSKIVDKSHFGTLVQPEELSPIQDYSGYGPSIQD